jgi:hypothetical protein
MAQDVAAERDVDEPRFGRTLRRPQVGAPSDSNSTVAQLLVEAAEHGLRLIARAEKLSREQRLRLRGEIEQLLAHHGLSAEEIRLNGEPIPAHKM